MLLLCVKYLKKERKWQMEYGLCSHCSSTFILLSLLLQRICTSEALISDMQNFELKHGITNV